MGSSLRLEVLASVSRTLGEESDLFRERLRLTVVLGLLALAALLSSGEALEAGAADTAAVDDTDTKGRVGT